MCNEDMVTALVSMSRNKLLCAPDSHEVRSKARFSSNRLFLDWEQESNSPLQEQTCTGYHSSLGTFNNSPELVKPWANTASGGASFRILSFSCSHCLMTIGVELFH